MVAHQQHVTEHVALKTSEPVAARPMGRSPRISVIRLARETFALRSIKLTHLDATIRSLVSVIGQQPATPTPGRTGAPAAATCRAVGVSRCATTTAARRSTKHVRRGHARVIAVRRHARGVQAQRSVLPQVVRGPARRHSHATPMITAVAPYPRVRRRHPVCLLALPNAVRATAVTAPVQTPGRLRPMRQKLLRPATGPRWPRLIRRQ